MGTSWMEYTFGDLSQKGGSLACGGCCGTCLLILLLVFFPASIHQLGQKKLGLSRNTITGVVDLDTTYVPGRYWVGFWKEFIEFPQTLNTIEFSDEAPEAGVQHQNVLASRDQDGKQIFLDLSLQYQLVPEKVGQLYKEMSTTYEDVYISALRDTLSKVGNRFAIDNTWENYEEVSQTMKAACVEVLAERHALCWDLQLWRVRLEGRYEQALIRTQVRKQAQRTEEARKSQASVRAKTQVILAEYRKNTTIIQSQGAARKYEIERAATSFAHANKIHAQANALKSVADLVKVNTTGALMNATQISTYQKLMMLHSHPDAHFVYSGGPVEPVNVHAARAVSSSRRLALPSGEASAFAAGGEAFAAGEPAGAAARLAGAEGGVKPLEL